MASSHRRSTTDSANPRTVLRNKLANDVKYKSDTAKKGPKISEMSPEARRAMMLAKEDSKENVMSSSPMDDYRSKGKDSDSNNVGNIVNGLRGAKITSAVRDVRSKPRTIVQRPSGVRACDPPRSRNMPSSLGANTTATARSRSTLSRTDPSYYSISDQNESCYNYGNGDKHRGGNYATSSLYNNDSQENEDDDHNSNMIINGQSQVEDGNSDEEDIETETDDNENNETQRRASPKSFVQALDRALEQNCISRLRGDITDTQGISEPGKVRALDGGRLTNAQEVVVNVCHDDDKELVFHDEDEESLDNAKTISEIRINIWMQYNEEFQPDNITDDLDIGTTRTDEVNDNASENKTQTKLAVSSKASMTPRGRNVSKGTIGQRTLTARSNSNSKPPMGSKDRNNNTVGARSKSRSVTGSRGDSRIGSAVSTDGSRRSGLSSAKKESYLKKKAKS